MKTIILSSLTSFPYFTIEAVKQLLGDESAAAGTIQTALYRWMKAGQIIQVKKGVYMTRRFFELNRADPDFAPMVSAILIPQSYLSLEYILQRNAILTEMTYPITAVTLKQTRVFENKLGTFTYRNIKADLYQGFIFSEYMGIPIAQATVAKALFDFLYLRPWKGGKRLAGYDLAEDLRLNLEDISENDRVEFAAFVEISKNKKMDQILKNLRKTVWRL
ncbi:MAG: type IV toxin-antitoxin system AbiEi family antitoxin domain-containing protein [Bellilinea sp.]